MQLRLRDIVRVLSAALFLFWAPVEGAVPVWLTLEPGLEVARFDARTSAAADQGNVTVLRVDPGRWSLGFYFLDDPTAELMTPAEWAQRHGLAAVANGGMYQADLRTHVGFCQADGRVLNRSANDYLSAAAFDPVDPGDPPFRIFDLDRTPLDEVAARYRTVLQNLRLIKRPGENRWQPQGDRWTETALAEDGLGRALLIQCAIPLTMHAFNELVLSLPLDVVSAQHLEGNLPAQLHIAHPGWAASGKEQGPTGGRALPFVLGVSPGFNAPGRPSR